MAIPNARTTARNARREARRAASNPWLQRLQRLGYAARGVLYGMMGVLAMGVALGVGGQTTDQRGGLVTLARSPVGTPLLVLLIAGLAAYSLWGVVRAVFDPLHRGDDAGGIVQRLGFLWSAFAYAALTVFALQFLAAGRTGTSSDTTPAIVGSVLAHPAGGLLAIGAGLVAIAAGLGQFGEAWRASFRRDLKVGEMTRNERRLVVALGRFGMLARGVTFALVGGFLMDAGLHHDAGRAHGYGGAFTFLLEQPHGRLLLGAVALGFVALGLHSFAAARWIRLMGSRG